MTDIQDVRGFERTIPVIKKKVTDSKYVIRNEVHTKKLMEFNALSFNHFGCTFCY